MATTTNYSWTTPDDTALVKDGAAAIRSLGSSIDTTTKALNPSTTLGDIEYRSATANTNTRLGIGTSGQVLLVSGGVPAWGTAASGGYTLLSTTTINAATVTVSSISQSYKHLFITIEDLDDTGGTARVDLQLNTDTGNNYYWGNLSYSGAGTSETSTTYNKIRMANIVSATNATATINIPEYTSTKQHNIYGNATWNNGDYCTTFNGYWNSANAVTSISILRPAGETYNGTMRIYGVS